MTLRIHNTETTRLTADTADRVDTSDYQASPQSFVPVDEVSKSTDPSPSSAARMTKYVPPTMEQPKKVAKSLKRMCLEVSSIEIKLSRAQEIVAAMYGWKDWYAMHSTVTKGTQRPRRAQNEVAAAIRRLQYVRALAAAIGVRKTEAASIVDKLKPDTLRVQ